MNRKLSRNLLAATGLDVHRLLTVSVRLLQLTPERHVSSKKSENITKNREMENKELKEAAINVAKSLKGGNWTKTAEELIARLQMLEKPEMKSSSEEVTEEKLSGSLLSTMKVARDFNLDNKPRRSDRRTSGNRQNEMFAEPQDLSRKRLARRNEIFTELYSVPRLGIFDAEKLKTTEEKPLVKPGLWELVNEETIKSFTGSLPRNAFEEMIQWTKEGKLWTFPIDNQADMHEERKYSFQDHVFFDQFLTKFPDRGPIRKFMELVTLGLSMNPYITVPEKHEHIQWFAEYFAQKQEVMLGVIGDDGKMKTEDMAASSTKNIKGQKKVEQKK